MPKNVSESKDAKKWPMDANFQAPRSTGRKVEMACATDVGHYSRTLCQIKEIPCWHYRNHIYSPID